MFKPRIALASLAVGSAMLLAVALPAAAAGKPSFSPVPFPDEILLPGGVFCDFDLSAVALVNTEVAKTFPAEANGDILQIVTGQLWVRLTNVSTGSYVDVNISGPSRYVVHADGTIDATQMGRLVAVEPGGFFVYSGRVLQAIDAEGNGTIESVRGSATDICAGLS